MLGMGDLSPLMTESLQWVYRGPYYWVDDHPLLYGNNGSLDPSTMFFSPTFKNFKKKRKEEQHPPTKTSKRR